MASSLLEADPLAIAKQLTRMEADLFKKATPAEFVRRIIHTQIPTGDANDITPIINLSGKIALWAVESILESEDAKERGRVLKFFITVADHCRTLRNFSSMVSIICGINNPAVLRLDKTWSQISYLTVRRFRKCRSYQWDRTLEKYQKRLYKTNAPAVPFIGFYFTLLAGNANSLGELAEMKKRSVIQDIQCWQLLPYDIPDDPSAKAYLDGVFEKPLDSDDNEVERRVWKISLQREALQRGREIPLR